MLKHPSYVASLLTNAIHLRPLADPDPLWAFNEFSRTELGDKRLTSRLQLLARSFEQQPQASIPQACGSWANGKAAYRFCSNPKVSFSAILSAHIDRTVERLGAAGCSVVLCPQDTTTLNFSSHPATLGLGPAGNQPGASLGMFLHSTLALDAYGQFFGLLHAQCWVRPNRKKSRKARTRHQKHIREKESVRWQESLEQIEKLAHLYPEHTWVSVADREADIYELLHQINVPDHRSHVLVRARHDRQLLTHPGQTLFSYPKNCRPDGAYVVNVPRHEHHPARQATLNIYYSALSFAPPSRHRNHPSTTLWAVWAQETHPPLGIKPINWCLLTTVPVERLSEAIERLEWYVKRWTIEEFHRVLKSGCQVEAHQLTSRERLQRLLAVDMVVAWRIMDINKAARLEPQAPANQWFSTEEWQALYCYMNQTTQPPQEPPTISQMVLWVAQLGGFLGRTGDKHPGPTTVGRGLKRLKDIVAAWRLFGPGGMSTTPKVQRKKSPKRCG